MECPYCESSACEVFVSECCRQVGGKAHEPSEYAVGHYRDLIRMTSRTADKGVKELGSFVPWHVVRERFGERALASVHGEMVTWIDPETPVEQAADAAGRVVAAYGVWVRECMHDAPRGEVCAFCKAVHDCLKERGYFVATRPKAIRDRWDAEIARVAYLVAAREFYARDALANAAMLGYVRVWRSFAILRHDDTGAESVLHGAFEPWHGREYVARCRFRGLWPGGDPPKDERLIAIRHLRDGRCVCGVYGMFDPMMTATNSPAVVSVRRNGRTVRFAPVLALADCAARGVVAIGVHGVRASEVEIRHIYIPHILSPTLPFALTVDADASDSAVRAVVESLAGRYGVPVTPVRMALDEVIPDASHLDQVPDNPLRYLSFSSAVHWVMVERVRQLSGLEAVR